MNIKLRDNITGVLGVIISFILTIGCTDNNDNNGPIESKYGLIQMSENDYNPDNTSYILQDGEPDSLLFNRNQRSFRVNAPLQVSITDNQEFLFRFYCPRGINNVIVWATIEGHEKELRFAEFTRIQPFQEFRTKIPFINKDKIYYTRQGEEVIVPATPDIKAGDIKLRIESVDPVYQGMINVKPKWNIWFGKYSGSNWGSFAPHLAREAVALSLNMAAMFSTSLFEQELDKWKGKLINNGNVVDINTLKKQITNHSGFCFGRVVNVVGLGGGNTYGLGEYVYLTHYADDANGSDTPYHEMAHCLGYGHSGNMTYYPAEGGFPTVCMKVYSQLSREKKLPVYSRRFLHTRRNKNLVENKSIYTASAYIIEDPELDAIDGGLSIPFTETDKAGHEGSPLSFTISVLDVPGATVETFQPKAVHLYQNMLYVANSAPGHYSLEIFDVSSGIRHIRSIRKWTNNETEETFAGEPTGVTRSFNKIYVANAGSRTDVFDASTYEFITCIGTGTWGEGNFQTVHAFDVVASQGSILIRDKRKLVVVLENDVQPGTARKIPVYSRSANLKEAFGTYGIAINEKGLIYATAQNTKKVHIFDPKNIREGNSGFMYNNVSLGFENAPQSLAFIGNRLFVTLRANSKKSELWEIDPSNGKLLQNLTGTLTEPEKITASRQTLLVVDRGTQSIRAIPAKDL